VRIAGAAGRTALGVSVAVSIPRVPLAMNPFIVVFPSISRL
jgi:hypothetical protein